MEDKLLQAYSEQLLQAYTEHIRTILYFIGGISAFLFSVISAMFVAIWRGQKRNILIGKDVISIKKDIEGMKKDIEETKDDLEFVERDIHDIKERLDRANIQ